MERIERTNLLLIVTTPTDCECPLPPEVAYNVQPKFQQIQTFNDSDHECQVPDHKEVIIENICPKMHQERVDESTCDTTALDVSLHLVLLSTLLILTV